MRYKATRGDIDSQTCLVQAANALDAAAERAEATNDVEGLLNVSAMWMKFSETVENFANYKQEQIISEQMAQTSPGQFQTGFQGSSKEKISDRDGQDRAQQS